jgi:hypothetical protein
MRDLSVEDLRQFSKFSRGAKHEIVVVLSFTHYLMQIYHDILMVYSRPSPFASGIATAKNKALRRE